jgi:hypothetical protein
MPINLPGGQPKQLSPLMNLQGMPEKERIPPQDVIQEDCGPPVTEIPKPKPTDVQIDIDDAQIEEPKDDVFKKGDKGR